MTIQLFISPSCLPCDEVREKLEKGQVQTDEALEVIDLGTDEGFQRYVDLVLSRDEGAVPSAYRDGQRCVIGFDEQDKLVFDCPTPVAPLSQPAEK